MVLTICCLPHVFVAVGPNDVDLERLARELIDAKPDEATVDTLEFTEFLVLVDEFLTNICAGLAAKQDRLPNDLLLS
jgi:hypothetical protein